MFAILRYRNFLMGCAALMSQRIRPDYHALLLHPTQPSVSNLQQWIEDAWKEGYDEQGASDLKRSLVGTSKWIGTAGRHCLLIALSEDILIFEAELSVAYTSRRIPSLLVDFNFKHISKEAGRYSVFSQFIDY